MLYIYLDKNQICLLSLKKTLLGQFETNYFVRKHEIDLLNRGRVNSVDLLASAIKEALTHSQAQEKDVFLILPQESFHFFKADIPQDIAQSAVFSFMMDKARASLSVDLDNCFFDFFVKETDKQKQLSFFAAEFEVVKAYAEVFQLVGLKLVMVLPETLALFKLFEKTLRREKRETIFYVSYQKDNKLTGYLFDSGGLQVAERWERAVSKEEKLEEVLKSKKEEFEGQGVKLNRIILSGDQSENVRQDTFTKEVGVWTNPLKRIIPDFYEEYLKMLVATDKPFPLLSFDMCFGAFVFSQENKEFQMLRKPVRGKKGEGFSLAKIPVFKREVLIFLVSAIVSFLAFLGVSRLNINVRDIKLPQFQVPSLDFLQKPTPTPTKAPTPTPKPQFKKEELKVNVLNGSGTAGKASEVKDLLTEAGYQEILTGNADNFDYETTVIRVKKEKSTAADVIKKDLSESVTNPKVETLDADEASDVVIIIGADLK